MTTRRILSVVLLLGIVGWSAADLNIETGKEEVLRRVRRQIDDSCAVADLVFVLDSSGSIGTINWERVLNFTQSIVSEFPIGSDLVRIGVNYYGNSAILAFGLNDFSTVEDVNAAIGAIPWLDQNTNTSGGIRLMYRDMFTTPAGARVGVPWIGIVITDGESTFDKELTIPEADNARNRGIILFAIGIGNQTSQDELRGIANLPSAQFVFNADSFEALGAIQQEIVETTCTVVSECTESADWVFILDGSGSVGAQNFNMMVGFMRNLTAEARVDEGDARIGLMVYSSDPEIVWNLNNYTTRREMMTALDGLRYQSGTTNTAAALRDAREVMFTAANGDRELRGNVVVLFTDGGSDNFEETLAEARLCRLAGLELLVVAVSDWVNQVEVREVASDPDSHSVFMVSAFDELFGNFEDIRAAVCNDGNECRNQPCRNGGQCVKQYGSYSCTCPPGYAGQDCDVVCPNPADVVLVLDSSTSMGASNYYALQDYAKILIRQLNIGDGQGGQKVALVTFGDQAIKRFDLNYSNDKLRVIDSISYPFIRARTNSAEAMRMVFNETFTTENGDNPNNRDIAIIFTDGQSTDRQAAFEEAARAHEEGITVLSVGVAVKGRFAREELKAFASDPDEDNFFEVTDPAFLNDITTSLIRSICNDVNDCATAQCADGSTCVDGINSYECLCPEGRSGKYCDRACDGVVDVIFAIDASGSIRQERFPVVLDFVSKVIDALDVRPGRAHIGALTFADDASLVFPLGKYTKKEDVLQAVKSILYTRGRTNTAAALRMLHDDLFTEANGDRPDAPNVAFLISDGESTVERENTLPEAVVARSKGIQMIIGSVETNPDSLELKGLASRPVESNMFRVDRFSELDNIIDTLSMSLCNDVDDCASNPCVTGQCVDELHYYRCECPDDRTGANCDRVCTASYDVAMILDASGSVDYDYELAQMTARFLTMGFNFNRERTQIGLITYQTEPNIRFMLSTYTRQRDIVNAIGYDNDMSEIGTNTASAVRIMLTTIFNTANGMRDGIPKVAIVITDGKSNIEQAQTKAEADDARANGVRVIVIGIGTAVNSVELEEIGDSPSAENVFLIPDVTQMEPVANEILDILCV